MRLATSVLQKTTELWISQATLAQMGEDGRRWYPLETGGILAGYRVGRTQVITDLVGPGPGAIHTVMTFEGDHDDQCEKLDRLYELSGGVTVYLGDWHTHPDGAPNPSLQDRCTLRRISLHPEAGCTSPVMIIGAGGPNSWRWKAHLYHRTLLGRIYSRPLLTFSRDFV